jgi:hypothetical protein
MNVQILAKNANSLTRSCVLSIRRVATDLILTRAVFSLDKESVRDPLTKRHPLNSGSRATLYVTIPLAAILRGHRRAIA